MDCVRGSASHMADSHVGRSLNSPSYIMVTESSRRRLHKGGHVEVRILGRRAILKVILNCVSVFITIPDVSKFVN